MTTSHVSRVKTNAGSCEISGTCNIKKAQEKRAIPRQHTGKRQYTANSGKGKSSESIRRDQLHNDSLKDDVNRQESTTVTDLIDKNPELQDQYKSIGFTLY